MNKFSITFLNLLLLTSVGYAQIGSGASLKPPVNILSPETATLGKYGTYNVNQYTGTPGINIPIYEIKDKELSIPISLNYDASGFIPNNNSGMVGLNWNLAAGGVITRVVKGVPDEKNDPTPSLDDERQKIQYGYIYGIQQGLYEFCGSTLCIEELMFFDRPNQSWPAYSYPAATFLSYEHNPDIFSFNFMGHSGTFFMGSDGQVKVSSERRYKVDLSQLNYRNDIAQDLGLLPSNVFNSHTISSITITADDGTKFYFGGKLSALEISFNYAGSTTANENTNRNVAQESGVISAWYLVKVTTPTGREINFDYGTYTEQEIAVLQKLNDVAAGSVNLFRAEFLDVRLYWRDYKTAFEIYGNSGSSSGYKLEKSLIKQVYLKKIVTELSTITFQYSTKNETQKFYSPAYQNSVNANPYYLTKKLDKIQVKDNLNIPAPGGDEQEGTLLALNYDFEYEYFGTADVGYRLFLKKLKSNNDKIYQFAYHHTDVLPFALTPGIDIWGYYNGQSTNTKLVGLSGPNYGAQPLEYETDFSTSGQNRLPGGTQFYAQIGLLKTVTYPTGGTTEFEFEPHTYRKILKKKVNASSGNSVIPEWETLSSDQYAGGARIKTITTIPGSVVHYKYNKDVEDDPSQASTGLLTDFGVYRIYVDMPGNNFDEKIFDDNITRSNTYSESHISYSEVKETVGDGTAGFTKYRFTTHETNPDLYYIGPDAVWAFGTTGAIPSYVNQLKRLARYSSRSIERGKLKKKEIYDADRVLVATDEYTYNEDPFRFDHRTAGFEQIHYSQLVNDAGWMYNAFRIYNYHDLPSQIVSKIYSDGQALTTTTNLVYKGNDNPLLYQKTVTKSNGSIVKTEYSYPEDMGGSADYPVMINRFMVASVVKEKLFIDNVLQSTLETVYDDVLNNTVIIKPVQQNVTNHTISPAFTYTGTVLSYYSNGNLKQSYKQNDVKTAYLWNYVDHFPIAEVKNVDDVADIAYTSFETNTAGGWTYNTDATNTGYFNPMGTYIFNLNYQTSQSIQKAGLNTAKQYVVSFWFKGTSINCNSLTPSKEFIVGEWTYKEYLVSGSANVTITGTGYIDELRLYPKGSLMSTYTYFPLYGLGAKCDINNQTSYFEYDHAGRLAVLRDRDHNIVKKLCYNFYGQPEHCDYTAPQWDATGQTRCKPCELNTNYTTNILQREEKDINTFSPTYNQFRWVDQSIYRPCETGWAATGNYRCVLAGGQNTGEQEREETNLNPCHSQYNQTRWVTNGTNLTACPVSCTPANCSGNDKKCINGVCETGIWGVVSFVKKKVDGVFIWECTYRYCFTDGSQSTYSQVIIHSSACGLTCFI